MPRNMKRKALFISFNLVLILIFIVELFIVVIIEILVIIILFVDCFHILLLALRIYLSIFIYKLIAWVWICDGSLVLLTHFVF